MRKLNSFRLLGMAVVLGALMAVTGGLVISQAAGGSSIQATVYDDAVRFAVQSEKVAILRAEVFDLGGKRLFDSGPVMGKALDWAMTTEAGERVAHGVYLYVITAWDSQGELVKSQVGKLALVPGGVGLGQAPALVSEHEEPLASEKGREQVKALAVNQDHSTESWAFKQVGIGTTSPTDALHVVGRIRLQSSGTAGIMKLEGSASAPGSDPAFLYYSGPNLRYGFSMDMSAGEDWYLHDYTNGATAIRLYRGSGNLVFNPAGNVGIGTTSPSAALEGV